MGVLIEEYGRMIIAVIVVMLILGIVVFVISDNMEMTANTSIAEIDAKHAVYADIDTAPTIGRPVLKNIVIKKGDKLRVGDLFEVEEDTADKVKYIRVISVTDPKGNIKGCKSDDQYVFANPGKYVICLNYHGIWAFNIPVTI